MSESKRDTPRFSAEMIGETDFAKSDAHVIGPEEYEELPELTDEMMSRAVRMVDGQPIPYDPEHAASQQQVTLHLDVDVIARFRASGPGWQDRMNAILRDALG